METTALSTVIGVFSNAAQANAAVDELRHANFGYTRIRLVERGTGGVLDTLKSMLTGQAEMSSTTAESLAKMGLPDYEAQYYQRELDANHVLLLLNADDRPEEAFGILRQSGAFDINSRLKMRPENGSAGTPDRSAALSNSDRSQQAAERKAQPATTPSGTPDTQPDRSRPESPAGRMQETT